MHRGGGTRTGLVQLNEASDRHLHLTRCPLEAGEAFRFEAARVGEGLRLASKRLNAAGDVAVSKRGARVRSEGKLSRGTLYS